ncbi:MAG: peptidylprolyl isomerase [Bacteroidaceae bacterium]|nr:peptidylprolyl isomerase [Bacteroidaceae bacterium]MBP3832914.1 peptidylprolyl isomerase [Bacteroidaceae bacterium]
MRSFVRTIMATLLLIWSNAAMAQDNVIDEVAWVVGDEAIWKSEVEEARLSALYEGRKFDKDPYCVLPEEMAVQKLFLHQAELDSIEVSDAEVLQRVDYMTNMYIQNIGSREKMEEYFNKTSSQIREQLRVSAREGLTVQKMQQKIMGDVKTTPSEVRRYYTSLSQDSIPYIPTMVEVEIITRKPKIPQEEIEDVKRRLRDYTERVNNGDSFTMLARLYSEDPGSAMSGGDLGRFMGRGELDPAFANVAFNLQTPDKISKVVESEFGYHIIQLIEKRGDRIRVRHILLKPHVPEEALNESRAYLDSIADEVRNGKFTFEEAAYAISDDKNTRFNGGLLPNEETQTSRFEMQDLPSEIAKVVDTMEVGEISKAINMTPRTGQEQTVIVKLKSRIKGHKATVSDDYQRLKEMVVQKKQEEMVEKWIQNKLKTTYVRISDNWKPSCDFKYKGWIK